MGEEELKAAFEFFDVEMKGAITASNLRKRLGAFHRSLSARVGDASTTACFVLKCSIVDAPLHIHRRQPYHGNPCCVSLLD